MQYVLDNFCAFMGLQKDHLYIWSKEIRCLNTDKQSYS